MKVPRPPIKTKISPKKSQRILIIRDDAIGDTITSLAAFRALRKARPDAYLVVLANRYNARIWNLIEGVDDILINADDQGSRYAVRELSALIKPYNFDVAIHFRSNEVPAYACLLAGIPRNIGDSSHISLLPIYRRFGVQFKSFNPLLHVMHYNFQLLEPLGIEMPEHPEVYIEQPEEHLSLGQRFLEEHGWDPQRRLVTIQVGTGSGNRPIEPYKYADYINALREKFPMIQVCVTGFSEWELDAIQTIRARVKGTLICHEKRPLLELMGIFKHTDAFVSVDTGPFHLAVAMHVPTLAIFGTKRLKPMRWGPWGTPHFIVRNNRRCHYDCFNNECPYAVCTDDISVSDMVQKTQRLFDGEGVTEAGQMMHWIQEAMNFLILYDDRSEAEAKAFQKKMTGWGFYTLLRHRRESNLMKFIREHDTLIIHNLAKGWSAGLKIQLQKVGAYVHFPPLLVPDKTDFATAEELISYYYDRYAKRLF